MPARDTPPTNDFSRVWLAALPLAMFAVGMIIVACSGDLGVSLPLLASGPPGPSPLNGVRQLVVVTSRDWEAVEGRLERWERGAESQPWARAGIEIPIVVGRNGMGWGRGMHAPQRGRGPVAREGDRRAPAGVFELGPAFGFAPPGTVPGVKLPYLQELSTTECVDDVDSRFYNMIVNRSAIPEPDWKSSEQMAEAGDSYRWGIVVKQNEPPMPGGGSCIFLHAWSSSHTGTAGCTGLDENQTLTLMQWLDPERKPALVQMPRAEYERVKQAWHLPNLEH